MSESWLSCKGCVGSDPTKDTVKINASQLVNDENVAPSTNQLSSHEQDCGKALAQGAQRWGELQEEAAKVRQRQQKAREAAEAAEAAKVAAEEERQRKQAQEEQRRREEEEEQAARKAAEEARLREEAQREEAERLRRAAEAVEKAAEEERQMSRVRQEVEEWCKNHGFQDVNAERKTFKGRKYPLHTAVKHHEADMVAKLLKCGARKDLKDSRGQTPMQLAQKIFKSGGNDAGSQAIIHALQ